MDKNINIDNYVLVVPDVHGRKFWKDALSWPGQIVFLGDLHDPYWFEFDENGTEITWFDDGEYKYITKTGDIEQESFDNYLDVVTFIKANINRVTLIAGNHDMHYLHNWANASRKDRKRYATIKEFMESESNTDGMFEFCKKIGNTIFSHAGISKKWLNFIKRDLVQSQADLPVDELVSMLGFNELMMASSYRGGRDMCSGPMWLDYHELLDDNYMKVEIEDSVAQIFGHTMLGKTGSIKRGKTWACVDSRKCFLINPYLSPEDVIDSITVYEPDK